MVFSSTDISSLAIFKVNLLDRGEAYGLEYIGQHHINLQAVNSCCQLPFLHQGSKSSYASMEKIVWLSLQHLNLYVCRNRFGVRDFNVAASVLQLEYRGSRQNVS